MKTQSPRSSSLKTRYRQLLCAGIFLASFSAYGQKLTQWTPASGDWSDSGNWTEGVPTTEDSRAAFMDGGTYDVTVSGNEVYDLINIYRGTTTNINIADGASLDGVQSITVGTTVGTGSGAAHLNVTGPSSGTGTLSWSGTQIGVSQATSGSTATFSGTGLQILDEGNNTVVGRKGNNNALTLSGGVQWTGAKLTVYGNTNSTGSDGLTNNRATITGAGTHMTLSNGLDVASGASSGTTTAANSATHNRILVTDGAKLSVTGGGDGDQQGVRIGRSGNAAQSYRHNNRIEITGAGSEMEVSGGTVTHIGFANANNYNNRLYVAEGGTFRTDGVINIHHIVHSRVNYLDIGDGGTLVTNNTIENNHGAIRLRSGGSLLAENLEGDAATATVNINGTGILEASGHIGENVTVNVGDGTAGAQFGFHESGNTLELDGDLNLNDGSIATFNISPTGAIDQIIIGASGSVTIADVGTHGGVELNILADTAYTFSTGDVFQLFAGDLTGLSGSFNEALISIPTLSGDLSWNLERFTAEYGYELTVVPEPSTVALGLGAAALAVVALRRRRKVAC